MRHHWPSLFRSLAIGFAILVLADIGVAQLNPASPPIADPHDTRFVGVKEDWTTPALTTSNLKAVPPVVGYSNQYPGYTVELLRVQWRFGDPLDLYVVKPQGVSKPPVILYLYSYPADTDTFQNEAWQRAVTRDGFAAVGFVTALTGHRYHDRPMKEWFVSQLQECLAVSSHDVQMVLNYLATRGDLDTDRVGVLAEGSGAAIAILTSAVDPRIKVLDAVDPWGDWPAWMSSSPFVPEDERPNYVNEEYLNKVALLDPMNWLAKVQFKRIRLQQSLFETTTPAIAKDRLRAAVPAGATVVTYKTPQEYNAAVNHNRVMEWIHGELRALPNSFARSNAAVEKR